MIFNSEGCAALRVDCSDFVLEFLEPAFDFPSGGVEFDHLLGGEFEIGGDQREDMVLSIDEDDFHLAFESAGHADDFGEAAFPIPSVNVYERRSRRASQTVSEIADGREFVSVFARSSPALGLWFGKSEKRAVDAQSGENVNHFGGSFSRLVEERLGAEPAVADDQYGLLKQFDYSYDQCRSDSGFGFQPFRMREFSGVFNVFRKRRVEFLEKREAHPAFVAESEDSGQHPAVSENPFGGVLFRCVIEMRRATGYFFPGFSVGRVVQRHEYPTISNRMRSDGRDEEIDKRPPRNFGGVEKIVEFSPADTCSREDVGEPPKDIACFGSRPGGEGDHECFENDAAIRRDPFGRLIEKSLEFHALLLMLDVNGHKSNIAQ